LAKRPGDTAPSLTPKLFSVWRMPVLRSTNRPDGRGVCQLKAANALDAHHECRPELFLIAVMHRLRAYHALLALFAIAAYVSAEWGKVHAWLGYGVAAMIVLRLALALTGAPQLGLMRFYPHFDGMKLGNAMTHPAISRTLLLAIAISLIGVTGTGIAMDQGRALSFPGGSRVSSSTNIGNARNDEHHKEREHSEEDEEGALSEVHEFFGNLLVLVVGLHVTYLLLFKRPVALFMVFLDRRK